MKLKACLQLLGSILFLHACKKDPAPPEPTEIFTFSKDLGNTRSDEGFDEVEFVVEEDSSIVVAYNTFKSSSEPFEELIMHFRKMDKKGIEIWTRRFQLIEYNRTYGMAKANDDGYFVTGAFSESLVDPRQNSLAYLIKTDAEGLKEWEQFYGQGDNAARATKVEQRPDGKIYLLTKSDDGSRVYFLDEQGNMLNEFQVALDADMALHENGNILLCGSGLAEINESGITQWTFPFSNGADEDFETANAVTLSEEGETIVFGERILASTNYATGEFFMAQINNTPSKDWELTFTDIETGISRDISLTPDGNLIAIGESQMFTSNGVTSEMVAYLVDKEGNLLKEKSFRFLGENIVNPSAIKQLDEKHFCVAGVSIVLQPPVIRLNARIRKLEFE